jgi:hypothetical protein
LLPNGLSAFRFADGGHYNVDAMVLAGEAIRPFPCPAGPREAPPPTHAPQPLSASALHAAFPGHTFYADSWHLFPILLGVRPNLFVAADGVLYGTMNGGSDLGTWYDVGRWQITLAGQMCWTWQMRDSGRERCYTVSQEDDTFELDATDRLERVVFRRVPGNPEGY